ncbi:YsnF/AvaK domain-containing protein [Kitasatospora sp. NPDC001660]
MTTPPFTAAPTSTAPEANVRTLGTPAPAAAPTAATSMTTSTPAPMVEPKPQTPPAPTAGPATPPPAPMVEPKPQTPPAPTAGPATPPPAAPVEITCREERVDITTEWHAVGTARLRKYVTSEQVERRVTVVRERVRVERMPVSDAERASLTAKDIAESVESVTLREERPVVRKYLAPIERVRLVVERYTAEEVIKDELRREHVEVHDNTPTGNGTNGANGTPTPNGTPFRPLS